jgi:Fe-S-cluster containining protein
MQIDVQVVPGADAPKIRVSCSDRTSVVPLSQLLLALRSLTDKVVQAATERERSAGHQISCKAGCGACCRQLVPISVTEADELPHLIARLSAAHRSRVMARFNDAISGLRDCSIWERLQTYSALRQDERSKLGLDYFRLGIPCPFLEEESCSIYAVRPLACRQYLVTSPAKNCSDPSPENIARVPLAADVLGALVKTEAHERNPPQHVPLTLALLRDVSQSESTKTVPAWMSLLLGQIKKIRNQQIVAGKEPGPPRAD